MSQGTGKVAVFKDTRNVYRILVTKDTGKLPL
jgi:hypothetical protein